MEKPRALRIATNPRPRIDLRQLHYLVAIADAGSISTAAQQLHLSQPPLTLQMQNLENEIGTALLIRHKKGVELTAAGALLAQEARGILARVFNSIELVRQVGRGEAGELRIGMIGTIMWSDFSGIFARFQALYTGVKCTLHELDAEDQIQALTDGRIDVGFWRTPLRTGPEITCTRVAEESIAAALPAGNPLVSRRRLQLADLAREPLVMMNPDASEFAGYLVGACRNAGFEPNVVHTAKQPVILLALVSSGRGIALLPESLQRIAWPGVVFRALSGPPLRADLYMAFRTKDSSSVVANFIGVAQGGDVAQST